MRFVAVIPLLVACVEPPPEIATDEHAIVGGGATTAYEAVPMVLAHDGTNVIGSCTGTLISPRIVMSAAHCMDANVGAAGYILYFGSVLDPDNDPYFRGTRNAVRADYHPGWNPADLYNGNDIGFYLLDEPAPVAPMPYNRASLDGRVDQPVQLVGWGITQAGGQDSGLKRHATSRLIAFDEKLVQDGNDPTGTCQGDSGGPHFMTIDGLEVVTGITSFGDADCAMASIATRVDAFTAVIDEYVCTYDPGACPAGPPPPPPPPDPSQPPDPADPAGGGFGETCSTGTECASGLCLDSGDGTGFCTDACADDDACVPGYQCESVDDTSVCMPGGGDEGGGGCSVAPARQGAAGALSILLGLATAITAWATRRRA